MKTSKISNWVKSLSLVVLFSLALTLNADAKRKVSSKHRQKVTNQCDKNTVTTMSETQKKTTPLFALEKISDGPFKIYVRVFRMTYTTADEEDD